MDRDNQIKAIEEGLKTAFIDGAVNSNLAYRPEFVSNDYRKGKKVLASIEQELNRCDEFCISVAFITQSGITPLLQTLKELEEKGISGKILTTDYLMFSEPKALETLASLKNIELKMFCTDREIGGFHTKGYIFKKEEIYKIIIGSSNMTMNAITKNREWNTKIVSTENGEIVQDVLREFDSIWNDEHSKDYAVFIEEYRKVYLKNKLIREQQKLAREEEVISLERYTLKPNKMQVAFIDNLKQMQAEGVKKALLISSTGTGKTYASAFAMRELGFKRVLFLVHRNQIVKQARKAFRKVFGNGVSMGMVCGSYHEYDKDYVFATVQTLSKEDSLQRYDRKYFDAIIYDEAHHVSAGSYKKVMDYFQPKFTLGMTATPDKRDDNIEGRNIYEIFDYKIAYEIRLQDAMEEDLLCPFHYFGITDLSLIADEPKKLYGEEAAENFRYLTSDERVKNVMEKANYYGYSGDRVKGLIFCSRIKEAMELSQKFNENGWRTIALSGSDSEETRANAIERLAGEDGPDALDYILSVDIFSEGVDVPEINQVIMLRPTQSPIVFIQQLGRGLRKAEKKEYVVVLDFIGNYTNNFMIPVALSGDRSYNPDTIRKYVISGNSTIPGASTVHFDEISKNKIFQSIDKIKGMKALIKESYISLKNRLGRVPYMMDFYENGEVDPLVIIKEYKTYQAFLESVEKEDYKGAVSDGEYLILEYLSKTILSGIRPNELQILRMLIRKPDISVDEVQSEFSKEYGFRISNEEIQNAVSVLEGHFVSKKEEYEKYSQIDILQFDNDRVLRRMQEFTERLTHLEFHRQVEDIIRVGLSRYQERYRRDRRESSPFVLYEKYSRRDVSMLMDCGKDLSSTMYGMKRIKDDVFIFVTYHKAEATDEKNYVDGKPDYADVFENNMIFQWDSQMGKGLDSSYMKDVMEAKRKHLLVKKSDAESNFYYMGEFDIVHAREDRKENNKGRIEKITKVQVKMHDAVREDLLQYLNSSVSH